MSTKSTSAPQYRAQLAEATKVLGTVHSRSPRPEIEREAGQVQGCRAVGHRDRVAGADAVSARACSKRRDSRPLRQPIRAQHGNDRRDVLLVDVLAAVGNHDSSASKSS